MRIPHVPFLSIVFCYCYWIHHSADITFVSGKILYDQQQSLITLKGSLKFEHEKSSKLVTWNSSIDGCEWRGVTCDKEGHVIGLDLSGEFINGGFGNSSSLFNLQNLQILNLSANNFSSEIPSGFSKLNNLTYLNLSMAGFVGQIPIEISNLTRLVTLDISSFSYLYGQPLKLENLRMLVQSLIRLRQLYMDGVIVTAQGNDWCHALLNLSSLQELSMSNCNLSGPLDPSLATLKNLSIIRLDQNNLSSSVPENFADFSNLTTLHLSSCGLTGTFPQKIFRIETLSDIDISFNYDLYGSLPQFPQNGALRALVLRDTNFSGEIPNSINNLRQLSMIDLSKCLFNGTLPSSMSRLRELTYLDLSWNDFTSQIPSLNMSKNLTHLDLSHNSLTGSITSVHLEVLRKLVQIDLQDNLLNGSIPFSLFVLPLVRIIQLSNNHFQGQLDKFSNISSSILETLDLSSNKLEGPIPPSIFSLKSLKVLQLSFNKLNGTVKLAWIQRLANLTTLALSHNNLSIDTEVTNAGLTSSSPNISRVQLASCNLKEFPSFLRNQSRITILDLSSNHINGSVPTWIWHLDSLVQLNLSHNLLSNVEEPMHNTSSKLSLLDLHSNRFQGKLPIFPLKLFYLDYSSNNFSFTIPSEVGTYLSFIIFLSLSKNNLSGSIPQSLCNNSNLLVLDVSYNHFNGTIPDCLTQSETLAVLNLQHNKFDGSFPDKFPSSCALRTLDLNSNLLRGPIPKSLSNCTSLEVLDLGNNQVDDGFPCFLNTISTLRVLVLRGNKFHDQIGCPDSNSTWPVLQIVDLAFNNFSGLLPAKCFKTWKAMMLDEDQEESKFNHIGSPVLRFENGVYYQDSVTLTIKGLQLEFVKVLNLITCVDFSSNNFHGTIAEELMNFKRLIFLNLSHNALTGQIPSSIGNLNRLESLDLSSNHFDGEIPVSLAKLTFLSYLNLSYNHLSGKIPAGSQLQTFDNSSFVGNEELCGSPLSKNCSDTRKEKEVPKVHTDSGVQSDWTFVSTGVGFGAGAGLVVAPLLFLESLKKWSNNKIDKFLLVALPTFGFTWIPNDDGDEEEEEEEDEAEEDIKENNSDMEEECDYNEEQNNLGFQRFRGWYCVLCSKLDKSKKKTIHDPRCTCYPSQPISTPTCPQSYSSHSHT